MKPDTLNSVYDESLGGKPHKNIAGVKSRRINFFPILLILFLLTVFSGLIFCLWMTTQHSMREIYYFWLIEILFSITGATLFLLKR